VICRPLTSPDLLNPGFSSRVFNDDSTPCEQKNVILVHAPVVKPCEPPAGIAKLCSFLGGWGVKCKIWDANLESLLGLLHAQEKAFSSSRGASLDTWTRRAWRNLTFNLNAIKNWTTYHNWARYKRAVEDLNRLLAQAAISQNVRLSLANYQHPQLSPTRSVDLIQAAEKPEQNPFYPFLQERLVQVFEEAASPVIGFSLNYLSQALCTFAMIGFVRKHYKRVKIILGGGLVTSWMRKPDWLNPFQGLVDFLVAGPGEYPLLSFLDIPKANSGNMPGRPCTPDYDFFPLDKYMAPGNILPYSSASGCYWNRCSFCPEKAEGNPYISIPVEEVISDLHVLTKKMNPVLIHFLDNALRPALLEKIAGNPPGAPWYGFARITSHLLDPDFCRALKNSGCVMLQLGLESGDQGVLDRLQKGINLEMASRALKNLAGAGIAPYIYLLFGTPAETITEAQKTLDFIVKHGEQIRFLNLAIFNLPVYSQEAPELTTERFYEGDLSLYMNFFHPQGWNRNLVRQFLDKEFKRHPAIAPILRRDPPFFTSNHAPFFAFPRSAKD
jgi:radical SAM superfamily enzyme YgiQ (UPF0313 family)